jgi:hypothetical protein
VLSAIGVIWLARGIPSEPELNSPSIQKQPHSAEGSGALREGSWPKSAVDSAVSSPSPIPADRRT